uniref:RNA helicase n=1 Tax=Rhizophora mucronata TaxID=61149 RepID=A0A2P2MK53_RHIMU
MAPKKKPQKPTSKSKPNLASFSSSSAPRLQISAENENRLRRLLLNSGQPTQPASAMPVQETFSKPQKAKKLGKIYENLSCEGFSDDQIELVLASLKENATFETALDWLCLNLPGSELPLKFSSGISPNSNRGSVGVVLAAKEGWLPSTDLLAKIEEDTHHVSVRIKGRQQDDDTLNWHQQSQADWIRQYLEQQEEQAESKIWDDDAVDGSLPNKGLGPRPCDIIVKEYQAARLEAAKAKEVGDKKTQEHSSNIIRKLKQELSDLGVSADILARDFGHVHTSGSGNKDICTSSVPYEHLQVVISSDAEGSLAFIEPVAESTAGGRELTSCVDVGVVPISSSVSLEREIVPEEESADVELGGFFSEDAAPDDTLPAEVLELQKMEKIRESCSEKNLEKLDGIWKKGDPKKIPKAVLHQLCQKSGWEAPKFSKVLERGKGYVYAVSILRKACGRGKNRKAGGLITVQLPDQNETFESAEDAQNRVAAFAINQLFPDLPIHMIITQPYASLFLQWKEGELSSKLEDHVDDRRAGFVNWLLNSDLSTSANVSECTNNSPKVLRSLQIEEPSGSNTVCADPISARINYTNDLESSYLRQQQENTKETRKYKEMLKTRAALPIAGLKGDTLQKLRENNVLVVCGETGSGKTTQVPQFVLDDMIESGHGGHCNIICTQPRRIAAISVAERVADERCEPLPGSGGSLVGYQVRLDSARNDKTKLLFCTTGILLRKLMGDRNLTGITHVIVDEVHERSLLGDFLLIVLKSLIEKKYAYGLPQLKVILMSATVDSSLFSRYFGNCPVLVATGRTHPVTTHFLEDIYESINYHLASDSPAYLRHQACVFDKVL